MDTKDRAEEGVKERKRWGSAEIIDGESVFKYEATNPRSCIPISLFKISVIESFAFLQPIMVLEPT